MRFSTSLLVIAVPGLAGCQACTYPFSVDANGSLRIPLGVVMESMSI
jgi:hypothetical protein